ncbi:MAG: putative inorganic polyphosphate/ATP-NAD kinase [Thermoanaerobacterales bacterium 50_218]|nr:MAG: putative inorganic polyphosphate/ATP-NAD kinase [Thermoanaerobacterales bacterium 50_218]HAA90456.1 NAD(+) kinase [Peptococcaceae bacterium]
MKRVGLVVNLRKKQGERLVNILTDWFEKRGIEVATPQYTGGGEVARPDFSNEVDLVITLGGDGTLLGTARQMAGTGVPILGVNLGRLGFLTDLEMHDLFPSLEKFLHGEYEIEERMMLTAKVWRDHKCVGSFHALNDVVITKGPLSRIIGLETYVDNEYIATYRADGIIVASPTGSTAYSLSAGGPIVTPELQLMILTPICPHTFYARPIVLPDSRTIRIILRSNSLEVMLTVDGQVGFPLQKNDEIIVSKADITTKLVKLRRRTFFEVLRIKMRGE